MNISCTADGCVCPEVILELLRAATLLLALYRDIWGQKEKVLGGGGLLE